MPMSLRISEHEVETKDGKFALFSIGECGVFVPVEHLESDQVTREEVRASLLEIAEHYLALPDDAEIEGDIPLAEIKRSIRAQVVEGEAQSASV